MLMTTTTQEQIVYCWKCGKRLFTHESTTRGIGPVCLRNMQHKYPTFTRVFDLDGARNLAE